MSTVAWDGRIGRMAADRLSTGHLNPADKVWRLADGSSVGACGDQDWIAAALAWFVRGGPKPVAPADAFTLLRITSDGRAYTYGAPLEPVPVYLGFYAIGSGSRYAMAAMRCGRTPEEAVRIAADFDHQTNADVHSVLTARASHAQRFATMED